MTSHKIFPDKNSIRGVGQGLTSKTESGFTLVEILHEGQSLQKKKICALILRRSVARSGAGFTLVEILIVIGIFMLLAALTLGIGVDTARRATVGSERTLVVELLERARSRSMNNIAETPHGVVVTSTDFVLFRGATYSSSDPMNEVSPRASEITVTGPTDPLTVVFAQLSGKVDAGQTGDIVLSNGDQTSTVGINSEGRIDW